MSNTELPQYDSGVGQAQSRPLPRTLSFDLDGVPYSVDWTPDRPPTNDELSQLGGYLRAQPSHSQYIQQSKQEVATIPASMMGGVQGGANSSVLALQQRLAQRTAEMGITPQQVRSQGTGPALDANAQKKQDAITAAQMAALRAYQKSKDYSGIGLGAGSGGAFHETTPPAQAAAQQATRQAVKNLADVQGPKTVLNTPLTDYLLNYGAPGASDELDKMTGFTSGLARGLGGFTSPQSLAIMGALGPVGSLDSAAGKAILGGFGAQTGYGAYERARTGDYGGALGELAAFGLPFAGHAMGFAGDRIADRLNPGELPSMTPDLSADPSLMPLEGLRDPNAPSPFSVKFGKARPRTAPVVPEVTQSLPVDTMPSVPAPANARGAEIYKQQIAEAINQAREIGRHDIADIYQKQLDVLNNQPAEPPSVGIQPEAVSALSKDGFTRAIDLYNAAKQADPTLTREAFAQQLYEFHRANQGSVNYEGPTGNAKPGDIFTATAADGRPIRYFGFSEKGNANGTPTPVIGQSVEPPGSPEVAPVVASGVIPGDRVGAETSVVADHPVSQPPVEPTKYAGNFNLDRMDTPQDVKDFLTDYVKQNADANQAARGSVSLAETRTAAAEMGLTPAQLKAAVPGQGAAEINALRNLHIKALEEFKTAKDAYDASGSDADLQRMTIARLQYDTLMNTLAGKTAEAGRTLGSLRILADADLARDPISQQVEEIMRPKRQGRTRVVLDPAKETFGQTNKLFPQQEAADAIHRIQQAVRGGKKVSSGIDPTSGKFDNVDAVDLAKVGGYLLEGGLRKFADWSVGMAKTLGEGLSDAQLQHTWANLRAEVSQRVTKQVQSTVFVDQLASKLHSRQAASDFVDHIGTETLHKLLTGEARTPEEEAAILDAYQKFQRTPPKTAKTPAQGALADVLKIVEENRNAQKEAQRAGVQRSRSITAAQAGENVGSDGKASATPEQSLDASLRSRVGKEGLEATKKSIGVAILDKIKADDPLSLAEKRTVGDAIAANRVKPTSNPTEISQRLSDAVKETHAQIAAEAVPDVVKDTPKDVALKMLLSDERVNAERIKAKMAGVGHNDTAALSRILREESHIPIGKKAVSLWKAGLLLSARTINKVALSHAISGLGDVAEALPAPIIDAIVGKVTGNGRSMSAINPAQLGRATAIAMKGFFPDAKEILLHGEENLKDIGSNSREALFRTPQVNSKIGQAYIETVSRTHALAYRVFRVWAFEKSLRADANYHAKNELAGGHIQPGEFADRVKFLTDNPTEEMSINAAQAAETAAYLQENKSTQAIRNFNRQLSPQWQAVVNYAFPFNKVSSNLVARYFQSLPGVGITAHTSAVGDFIKVLGKTKTPDGKAFVMDANTQRTFVKMAARQGVGLTVVALGAYLGKKGVLTGYGGDYEDQGRLHLGNKSIEVKGLAPFGNLLAVGATLTGGKLNPIGAAIQGAAENPYSRTGEVVSAVMGHDAKRAAGTALASTVPAVISDWAAEMDDSKRKKSSVADYVKERIPYIRQKLPATGNPEANKMFDPTNTVRIRR